MYNPFRAFLPLILITTLVLGCIVGVSILFHNVWDSTGLPDPVKMLLSGLITVVGLALLLFAHPLYDRLVQQQQRREQLREQTRLMALQRRHAEADQEHQHWLETQHLLNQHQLETEKIALEREKVQFEREKLYLEAAGSQERVMIPEGSTFVREEAPGQYRVIANPRNPKQIAAAPATEVAEEVAAASLHIPTFRESLMRGDIGPGQKQVLICYELERDEETLQLTGKMTPYQDVLQNNCTMLLGGGSKSGKTTLMSHLSAQEAMMNALFYIIDPHLIHPEKSIAVRLQAFKHAFILPPAMTDVDVAVVLNHAKAEAWARLNGKETKYSGRPIVFMVDEALALIGRAQRTDNKDIRNLYIDLMLFMRDLGTQYNKFDMNGIFATQYVTKDAFKIPGCSIDFRDACQNQTLLRLPPNQAQAMRLLETQELRGIRRLPPGHGYMGFFTGDIIRMAAGNVTVADLEEVGKMVAPAPLGTSYTVPSEYPQSTDGEEVRTRDSEHSEEGSADSSDRRRSMSVRDTSPDTGKLTRIVDALPTRSVPDPVQGTGTAPVGTEPPKFKKTFTPEQEVKFLREFEKHQSIKKVLIDVMRISYGDYQAYASSLVETRNLRKRA